MLRPCSYVPGASCPGSDLAQPMLHPGTQEYHEPTRQCTVGGAPSPINEDTHPIPPASPSNSTLPMQHLTSTALRSTQAPLREAVPRKQMRHCEAGDRPSG